MKRMLFALCVLILGSLAVTPAWRELHRSDAPALRVAPAEKIVAAHSAILAAYGKLPLTFEANQGQTDPRVKFLAHGSGYTVFLTGDEATLLLDTLSGERAASANVKSAKPRGAAVRLALAGSNQRAEVEALDIQPGSSNYLIGNDPSKWRRNVPHFAHVKYHHVYPGVDLVYYGNQGQLESDYVVAPGALPSQIGLRIEGANKLKLDSQGDLVIATAAGDALLHRPRAYQQIAGSQREIAANYVRRGPHAVGIEVASYDHSQLLIIDPVLSYSTYLGGTANQVLSGIAADSTGFAYIAGITTSANFPTTAGALQTTLSNATSNAFVTKLKQDGSALVYSTFLGGTGTKGDGAGGIAVDGAGDAYIVGNTSSTDFPVTPSAYQSFNKGGGGFFTKLDPTGTTLLYSTYLSGSGSDELKAIAIDTNGNAYITGSTTSTDFPIVISTALQSSNNSTGGLGTAFLSRIDPGQSGTPSLVYSTYLGGSTRDVGTGVAVDAAFNAYIIGFTTSTDFPQPAAPNGFQTTLKNPSSNFFVARIDTTQPATLVYSTYLGGTPDGQGSSPGDVGTAIAVPATGGIAYITGYTYSADFPLVAPLDSASNTPFQKAIVARVNTTKSGAASLPFSTYLGGTVFATGSTQHGADLAYGIALDSLGNAYVTGTTSSSDFPVTPGAPQPSKAGVQNAFLSELNPTGSAVLFSTYLGGSIDAAQAVAVDGASPANAYIAGITGGSFPTTPGAFQKTDAVTGANNNDGFVAKISPGAVSGVFVSPAFLAFSTQAINTPSSVKTVTLFNDSATTLTSIVVSFTGTNATDFTQGTSTCAATLAVKATCTVGVIFTPTTSSAESATVNIADSDSTSPQTVALTGTGQAANSSFTIAASPTSASVAAGATANITVTVTGLNGFTTPVALACAGAPVAATCTLTPSTVTPTAGGATSTAAIVTTARTMLPPTSSFRGNPRLPLGMWAATLVLLLLVLWIGRRQSARRLAWTLSVLALLSMSSCSGLPSNSQGSGGTPAGIYTITITGTAGSQTQQVTVSLTVS